MDELKNGGHGYHRSAYPNIEKYLNAVDVGRFKKAVAEIRPAGGKEQR